MEKFKFRLFFSLFFFLCCSPALFAQSLSGHWEGALSFSGNQLQLVLNIEEQKGELKASLDSPDQGAYDIKVDSIWQKKDSLYISLNKIGAAYKAKYNKEEQKLQGEWQQQGQRLPLEMQRATGTNSSQRPQMPEEPFPYHSEEVRFENKEAGIKLAGTFTRPKEKGQHPAVVLISGSGPQDRDETIMGHKPFLVLADYLTRQGLAVLRYDDRGFGQSQGNFTAATTQDFASDAAAAVDYLQYRPDVQANQIGLLGHSEGGIIAPLVAQEGKPVAFLVLLAAPVLPGNDLLMLQAKEIMKQQGASGKELQSFLDTQEAILEVVRTEPDKEKAAQELRSLLNKAYPAYDTLSVEGAKKNREAQLGGQINQLLSPWFRHYVTYDPAEAFKKLDQPTLALYGSKDLQVPAEPNAEALRQIKNKHNKDNIELKVLEGLNHLFQPADTGLPQEYKQISTTISPEVLQLILEWTQSQLPPLNNKPNPIPEP